MWCASGSQWRKEPTEQLAELRDLGLLKLFFGAPAGPRAAAQLAAHQRKLAEYEWIREQDSGEGGKGPRATLDAGIAHEREWVRYWKRIAGTA